MADSLGVDFSFARLTAAQLKAAGFTFAARYLASSTGKRLTAGEVSDFQTNGIDIVLVWEDEATAALGGFNQGQHDAQVATEQANALGIPANIPIYLAVDFDINDAQKPVAAEYFKGAESVSPRFRAGYGGYYLIEYMFDNGLIDFGWQATAWSGGQIDPRAQIYQNGQSAFSGQADIDEARQTNFGQWSEKKEEPEMITDEYHVQALFTHFWGRGASPEEVAGVINHDGFADLISYMDSQQQAKDWNATTAIGIKAVGENWQGQIADLTKQIAELKGEKVPVTVNPTTPPLPNLTNNVPSQKVVITQSKSFWQNIGESLTAFWHVLVG